MAKKTATTPATPVSTNKAPAPARTTGPVRNSAIPKIPTSPVTPIPREISHDMIARRAYEISISGTGGSDLDNWLRAERELKGV